MARGLCSRHYQRVRRGSTRHSPGPAPRYPRTEGKAYPGAPTITIRLEPDLLSWVRSQGGAAWVRHVLRQLREMSTQAAFARHWRKLQKPVGEEPS